MNKEDILKILEGAKDKNGDVPMRLVRQAFEKLPEPCTDTISRQMAINALRKCSVKEVTPAYMLIDKAEVMAELMQLPSAQPEYRLDEWCTDCKEYDTEKHCCPRFNQVIRTTLDEMESERKKGEWIDFSMSIKGVPTEACGECGEWSLGMGKNFCPNCGADMRGEQYDSN